MSFNLFSSSISLFSKVLDLRAQRHDVVTSNIANAETPNYKSVHVDFEDELKKALPPDNALKMKRTDPSHMPATADFNKISPTIDYEVTHVNRPDGNTVDLDKEVVKMSKNQLMYSTVSQLLAKKFKGLVSVMKEAK